MDACQEYRRPTLRVGIDVADVSAVLSSIETFGDRYLDRVYTAHELATCGRRGAVSAARLGARFAAKEAFIKVIRPAGPHPDWRSIGVRSSPGGACELELSGSALDLAAEAGICELAVSLTHEGAVAAALVVALCT